MRRTGPTFLSLVAIATLVATPARSDDRRLAVNPAHAKGAPSINHTRVLLPVTRGIKHRLAELGQEYQLLALAARNGVPPPPKRIEEYPLPQPNEIIIDVLVAYTKNAAANYRNIENELIANSIEDANRSFRVSKLGHIKLRLVHSYQVDYREEGLHFDHLWRFADRDDGYMDDVHALRDRYRADVAVLIVDDPNGCGLATRVQADAEEAFAVVHHACAAAQYTLAHEIGHLIGARHELSFVSGGMWRDIMASRESCGGCPRMPIWSNPRVLIGGEPAGTAELDNAHVIEMQAARVAAFR